MSNLFDSVREYVEIERILPKQVAALILQFISNDEKDYKASHICQEIVEIGTFASSKRELKHSSCSFLLDYLSLGRIKYAEFSFFFLILTSYNELSLLRSQVNLLNELQIVTSNMNHPIGITIPYIDILATTVLHWSNLMKLFRVLVTQST